MNLFFLYRDRVIRVPLSNVSQTNCEVIITFLLFFILVINQCFYLIRNLKCFGKFLFKFSRGYTANALLAYGYGVFKMCFLIYRPTEKSVITNYLNCIVIMSLCSAWLTLNRNTVYMNYNIFYLKKLLKVNKNWKFWLIFECKNIVTRFLLMFKYIIIIIIIIA